MITLHPVNRTESGGKCREMNELQLDGKAADSSASLLD